MELKLDLHVHSVYSPDSFNSIDEINNRIREQGFDGYALADHDTLKGLDEAHKKSGGLVFIPAMEVSARRAHVVTLDPIEIVPAGLSLPETEDGRDETYRAETILMGLGFSKEDLGLEYQKNEIIVCSGAKHCLYNLFISILNRDQEVIVPTPYWVSYPDQVKMADGNPVFVHAREENGFRITPDELKANISGSTKAIIINNPSNPTGSAYTREQLMEVCEAAVEEGLLIVAAVHDLARHDRARRGVPTPGCDVAYRLTDEHDEEK